MLIKSFAEACKIKKLDAKKILPNVSAFPKQHQKALTAIAKLYIIAEVLNDGWKPNWNDSNEYKYYPWFYLNKPGFRFHGSSYDFTLTAAAGGSRLCFKSREISDHAGKKFAPLFKDAMTLSK